MMYVAVDLGGSNADIVVAGSDGRIIRTATLPWASVLAPRDLLDLLATADVAPVTMTAVGVTGGRHRALPTLLSLPDGLPSVPLLHVDELRAIGHGGLLAAGVSRALVMSMGTGTAFISAEPQGLRHLGGTAVGGGTVLGLARLLLGETDPRHLGALAEAGDPTVVDLSVGDIVGGPVGIVPASMTAAHFGKVARPTHDLAGLRAEDIAAGLMELVGQALGRMGLMAARAAGQDVLVMTGHLIEWAGIRRAVERVAGTFGGELLVPPEPGLATARGVLAALLAEHRTER